MADARKAALDAIDDVHCKNHNLRPPMYVRCDVDHPECVLDALVSSPEVRAALTELAHDTFADWRATPGGLTFVDALVVAILGALAGASGTEAGRG